MNPLSCLKQSKCLQIIYGLIGFFILSSLMCRYFGICLYWNTTASNPYTLFVGSTFYSPKKECYVVAFPDFSFNPALQSMPVIKKIKGLPGDYLESNQMTVSLNGQNMGQIENLEKEGIVLSAIETQTIPKDFYYLGSDQQNQGFDSRYAQFGLVHQNNIRCQVWPIY